MKKVLKWIGIVLGVLVGVLLIAGIGLAIYGNRNFKPVQADRPLYPITADASAEGLARGKYLMENVMLCTEACHTPESGAALSGMVEQIDQGPISAVFAVPNLTSDVETGLGDWSDAEIARAIREGVGKDERALMIMPSYSYTALSDADVADVVGYLRSLQPVSNAIPDLQVNAAGRIIAALGMFGEPSLQEPITEAILTPPQGTVEYGAYLVSVAECRGCHLPNLAGGAFPFADPEAVLAANLTPAGELVGWTEADFIKAVTLGVKPSGRQLDEAMPHYKINDADLAAIFAYLKTVPPATPK